MMGGGPRVVVSTAAFHARVRGSVPGLGGLKETKMFLPHPRVKVNIVGSLHDREVACSASDRQGSNLGSCVWRTVSSQSSHHPQEVLLAQFSLYVHKGGLKPDSFHFFIRNDNTIALCISGFMPTLCTYRLHLARRTSWGFEIQAMAVWARVRYLSATEAPHNIKSLQVSGKETCCFFETWKPQWGSIPRSPISSSRQL